jgi:hypothetical protein
MSVFNKVFFEQSVFNNKVGSDRLPAGWMLLQQRNSNTQMCWNARRKRHRTSSRIVHATVGCATVRAKQQPTEQPMRRCRPAGFIHSPPAIDR